MYSITHLIFTGDCFEDITAMEIYPSLCNDSKNEMIAFELQWNLPLCPGWEEIQFYNICGTEKCMSHEANIFKYHTCGIPDTYTFNVTAMNLCTETMNTTVTYNAGKNTHDNYEFSFPGSVVYLPPQCTCIFSSYCNIGPCAMNCFHYMLHIKLQKVVWRQLPLVCY